MRKIAPLTWLMAGLVTALAIVISGCSTEDPWNPTQSQTLNLTLVSGPSDSIAVRPGNPISFSWTSTGGSGQIQYQYNLDGADWSALTRNTFVTFPPPSVGGHQFNLRAQGNSGNPVEIAALFIVSHSAVDTVAPVIAIVGSPMEGSFIATGSIVTFAWHGFDSLGSGDNVLYQYVWNGDTSGLTNTRTVTFSNVGPADPAEFSVWAQDEAGNVSDPVTVTFAIKDASVLVIDDFLWLDAFGNVDRAKERDQKAFYRQALAGFAIAEWDNDTQGIPPDTFLARFTTVVWAADANVCDADPNFRLYYDIGALGGGVLKTFMDGGGHVLITGSEVLNYLWNTIPPGPADYEAAYLGVSDTLIITSIDSTWWHCGTGLDAPPTAADSITVDTLTSDTTWWNCGVAYDTFTVVIDSITTVENFQPTWLWEDHGFTWVVKDPAAGPEYPDSMKIDVAKNGDQIACTSVLDAAIEPGVRPLFRVGLDVSDAPPPTYGMINGWIYEPGGTPISASILFDTYSMPLPEITQTFHAILTEFGE